MAGGTGCEDGPVAPEVPPAQTITCEPDSVPTGSWVPDDIPRIDSQPAWSAGTDLIAYTHSPQADVDGGLGLKRVHLRDLATGEERVVASGHSPALSPDARWLAYAVGTRLWILDLTSQEAFPLEAFAEGSFQPRWTRQGDRILFIAWTPSAELWCAEPDGSNARALGISTFSADWSPDGQDVVYVSGDGRALRRRNLASGEDAVVVELSDSLPTSPRWSPTGDWIAYRTYTAGTVSLWLVAPDGTRCHEKVRGAGRSDWSPSGRVLIYEFNKQGPVECRLRLLDVETGEDRPVLGLSPRPTDDREGRECQPSHASSPGPVCCSSPQPKPVTA